MEKGDKVEQSKRRPVYIMECGDGWMETVGTAGRAGGVEEARRMAVDEGHEILDGDLGGSCLFGVVVDEPGDGYDVDVADARYIEPGYTVYVRAK